MANDIFISYSRRDLKKVKALKLQIERATGASCWMDLENIEADAFPFTRAITEGINTCRIFIFMLSENSQDLQVSNYALRELNLAMKKAKSEPQKHVVIVNIDGSQMCDEFYLMYSFANIINWNDKARREKLFCEIQNWTRKVERGNTKKLIAPEDMRLIRIEEDGKYGFADESGNVVIPCQWEWAWSFSEGLAPVQDDKEKWGYIDKTGDVVIPCKWKDAWDFSEGLAAVMDDNLTWGYIDKNGEVVIPCQWLFAGMFSEGLADVMDLSVKCGYIDKTGNVVIPCEWRETYGFSKGLAWAMDDNEKWNWIDKTGKVVREL